MNNPNIYGKRNGKSSLWKYLLFWLVIIILVITLVFTMSGRRREVVVWTHNDIKNYLTLEDNSETTNNDSEVQESLEAEYLARLKNIEEIKIQVGPYKTTFLMDYMVQRTENKQTVTYYYRATYEFAANDGGNELTQIKGYLTQADDFLIENQLPSIPIGIVDTTEPNFWLELLQSLIPILIVGLFAFIIIGKIANAQGGGKSTFDFGKSKARREDASTIRFSDVAGCEDEKEEMKEIVDYLKNPRKYAKSGARIPKGVILKGPPGTGKTLLAKAVAGEASVPFYYISGSDFLEMFVGVGASRVRDMFKKARLTAPCIIFIDEIDAVARQRGTGLGGGHDEREQTLNQLLVEMDGFENNSGIIVLAATNRIDVLDPALLRPGRFDRQIDVNLPDLKGRVDILKVHSRNKTLASDVNLEAVAKKTPGFSGAELENVMNEAAILSVRNKHDKISSSDIDEAIDRVIGGPAKKTKVISERTKRMVAYHEAGHAVIGLKVALSETVQKITIIPRGDAGGYVLMTPKDESMLQTKGELLAKITSYLAGRASEEIFFDDVTTGAHSDIERATQIARVMVTELGMSPLGPVQYERDSSQVFLGRDYGSTRISGEVANEIDKAVREIIESCLETARNCILQNKDMLILIAETLLKYETITAEEIDYLIEHGSLDEYKAQQQKNAMNSVEPDTKEAESNPEQTDSQENSSLDELKDTKDDSTDDKQE
ncbi:aTP-dependent zinc metalloprotease FtsH 1 [Firmicutes bacterium CAG:631]|nr:aTP-dependent zinc metalloprotease FtsH 1 [Firmicutes bacterium CAG:631]